MRVVAVRWRLFSQHVLLISSMQLPQGRQPVRGARRLFQGALRAAFSQPREPSTNRNNSREVVSITTDDSLAIQSAETIGVSDEPAIEAAPATSTVSVTESTEVAPTAGSRKCGQCNLYKPRDEFSNNQWLKSKRRCRGCQGFNKSVQASQKPNQLPRTFRAKSSRMSQSRRLGLGPFYAGCQRQKPRFQWLCAWPCLALSDAC